MVSIKRGDILLVNLDPVKGSEQGMIRSVLVIQNDTLNKYSPTTIIAPITSKIYTKEYLTNVIIKKEDSWKMDVKPDYTYMINKLATGSAEFSKAEQETLAIIAYKQPIKQSVIIKIRGNKAYDHIKKFSDLQLIKRKKSGHTYEISLSDDFYDYFNVSDSENPLESIEKIEGKIKEEIKNTKD